MTVDDSERVGVQFSDERLAINQEEPGLPGPQGISGDSAASRRNSKINILPPAAGFGALAETIGVCL